MVLSGMVLHFGHMAKIFVIGKDIISVKCVH